MRIKNILLTSVLVMILVVASVFSVFAEETAEQEPAEEDGGLLASLFGEGGLLEELLAEVTQEDAAEETAGDEMAQEDGEAGIDLSGLLDTLQRGAEGFSLDALDELLGQYIGGEDDGDGDSAGFDFDMLYEATTRVEKAIKAYIINKNSEIMDLGDVQIVSVSSIWTPDTFSGQEDEFQELDILTQFNYTVNEENQLILVSDAKDIALLTLQKNEDGSYTVADAEFAEDGDNYMESIEALCDKVGKPVDECMETIDFAQWMALYELRGYMDEHPEVTGIEYDGQVRTYEELVQIQDDLLSELAEIYAEPEEDAAESSEEDTGLEVAD